MNPIEDDDNVKVKTTRNVEIKVTTFGKNI